MSGKNMVKNVPDNHRDFFYKPFRQEYDWQEYSTLPSPAVAEHAGRAEAEYSGAKRQPTKRPKFLKEGVTSAPVGRLPEALSHGECGSVNTELVK